MRFLKEDGYSYAYPPKEWLKQGLYSRKDIRDLKKDFKYDYEYFGRSFFLRRDYKCRWCENWSTNTSGGTELIYKTSDKEFYKSNFFKYNVENNFNQNLFMNALENWDKLKPVVYDIKTIPCYDGHQLCWFLSSLPSCWHEKVLNAVSCFIYEATFKRVNFLKHFIALVNKHLAKRRIRFEAKGGRSVLG